MGMRSIMLLLPQYHLLLSRHRERERHAPFCNAGPGRFVPMRSIMLLLPQYHLLLSRQRERERDTLPFAMLDQGDSYLCEASCFFFHNIIYFSLDRERERETRSLLQCWTREIRTYAKHHA